MQLTLPAKYYTDATYFTEEMESHFYRKWFCVGRAEQIPQPGNYFLATLLNESLIVLRGEDGKIRSFYNICRHRGTRLCEKHSGSFVGRIQCPYHAWTYALDGRLVGAPQMADTSGFHPKDYPLEGVACEVWDGHIFLKLESDGISLFDQLGAGLVEKFRAWRPEDLRLSRSITYDVKANWKLLVQNYSECVHCPVIHPTLKRLSHFLSGENEPAHAAYLGGKMALNEGVKTMTLSGTSARRTFSELNEEQRRHVYYYWINPNLLLSMHPDYMMVHRLWPRQVDRTEVTCEFFIHPEDLGNRECEAQDALEFWDGVNREDWHVSELSQLGIRSRGYRPGPYSAREGLLHDLDRLMTE